MDTKEARVEWLACSESFLYFVDTYVWIENANEGGWIRLRLWPAQADVLLRVDANQFFVLLKARQLGLTWLLLAYILWLMLFKPAAAVAVFSKREEEARDLLDKRLKGMYQRLPEWMQCREIEKDSTTNWVLSNGSWCRAFSTKGGDSYTFSFALVDEADLAPELSELIGSVKPATDAGGKLALISRSNKKEPNSEFKQIYRAAKKGESDWEAMFLPWSARPERDVDWYEAQIRDSLSRTGSLDYLHEQYPATDTEALAPRSQDKRIPAEWLERNYIELEAVSRELEADSEIPSIPGLEIYKFPESGRRYVIGADPAEGNPSSDDSSLTVLDAITLEEVAVLSAKIQPKVFGSYIDTIGIFYNQAGVMVERNNHGHAVIGWLEDFSNLEILEGPDEKLGWLSNSLGKTLLYTECADAFRDGTTTLHSFETYVQLASIEGATLRAPSGMLDDRADSYALAIVGAPKAAVKKVVVAAPQVVQAEMVFGDVVSVAGWHVAG